MRAIFYGWYLTAAIFIVIMTTAGLGFYALPVFLSAFVAEFNLPLTGVSYAVSVFFLSSALAGPLTGRVIEKYDIRYVICLGAIFSAALLALAGYVTTLPRVYVFFALLGATYAFCSLIPAATLIARWFSRQRARAMALAHTGLSLGGILLTPLAARHIQEVGIAAAAPAIALVFLIMTIVPTMLFIRSHPADMGLAVDGGYMPVVPPRLRGTPFRLAVSSHLFVYSTLAWAAAMMAQIGGIAHLYNLASTQFDPAAGQLAIALLASASLTARFIGGWAMARFSPYYCALALFLIQAAALMLMSQANTEWLFFACVLLFGATVGNILMAQPLLLAAAFGPRHYGGIYALGQMFASFGGAAGPGVIALFYAWGGDYLFAYALSGVSMSFVAFGFLLIARPRSRF